MGLRDRLRGILGREHPESARTPGRDAPRAEPRRLHVVAPVSSGPAALTVDRIDPTAEVVGVHGARPRGARLIDVAELAAYARTVAPSRHLAGRAVVVVGVEDEAAAAVAERLAALGVDAGWLRGGMGAWKAAGRAEEGS